MVCSFRVLVMVVELTSNQRTRFNKSWERVENWMELMDPILKKRGYSTKKIKITRVFTSRATSRHAQVNRLTGTLNISVGMFNEGVSERDFDNTLLHEMCHMYEDAGHGHGPKWKLVADIASQVSGLSITRCSNIEGFSSVNRAERREQLVKKSGLVFKCEDCGQIITRTRRSNFTENYDKYRCGRCHGTFIKI